MTGASFLPADTPGRPLLLEVACSYSRGGFPTAVSDPQGEPTTLDTSPLIKPGPPWIIFPLSNSEPTDLGPNHSCRILSAWPCLEPEVTGTSTARRWRERGVILKFCLLQDTDEFLQDQSSPSVSTYCQLNLRGPLSLNPGELAWGM